MLCQSINEHTACQKCIFNTYISELASGNARISYISDFLKKKSKREKMQKYVRKFEEKIEDECVHLVKNGR